MRHLTVLTIVTIILLSCNRDSPSNTNIVGKYVNTFERDAIHYIVIRPDSTFLHYYKKGELMQENSGVWDISVAQNDTEIVFKTWKSFGYAKRSDCETCIRFVRLVKGSLIFNVDVPSEMNFQKE
jgi:hypothetical protein